MELLTLAEVCRRLALSRPSVYRLVASGRLPAVRIVQALRFRTADVDALIDRSLTSAAPGPDSAGPRAGVGWAA